MVTVAPGTSTVAFQALIDSHPAGTTFTLAPGRYPSGRFLIPKSGTQIISTVPRAAILDLQHADAGIMSAFGQQTDVTLQGLTIIGGVHDYGKWPHAQVQMGPRWKVIDCDLSGANEVGLTGGDDAQVLGGRIHHQGRYGFTFGPGKNFTVDGIELDHNNTRGLNIQDDAGGCKVVGVINGTTGTVFRGIYAHDNNGHALWSDWGNKDVLYENNVCVRNAGIGIFHEASHNAVIRNNVLMDNAGYTVGKDIWFGADIFLGDSNDVEISGNIVQTAGNGIAGIDSDRGSSPLGPLGICNVVVKNNVVKAGGKAIGWVTNRTTACPTPWTETANVVI